MKTLFKRILEKYNISQKDIALLINKSESAVSKYCTGMRQPDIESYMIIADFLKVSLDELFQRSNKFILIAKEEYEELIKAIKTMEKIVK